MADGAITSHAWPDGASLKCDQHLYRSERVQPLAGLSPSWNTEASEVEHQVHEPTWDGEGRRVTAAEYSARAGRAENGVSRGAVASGPPKELLRSDTWSDRIVQSAGVRIVDVPVVLVGGGLGSFVFADYLRLAGVPAPSIRVLSAMTHPWESYQYLAETSQIADEDRLRSDSQSTPDNPWGFPSYAFREAFGARDDRFNNLAIRFRLCVKRFSQASADFSEFGLVLLAGTHVQTVGERVRKSKPLAVMKKSRIPANTSLPGFLSGP